MSTSERVAVPDPQQLDAQSPVHIDEWVQVGSPLFKKLIGDQFSFDYFTKVGFRDPPFLFLDELGRVWGKSEDKWFPFHDRVHGKNYGYRYANTEQN